MKSSATNQTVPSSTALSTGNPQRKEWEIGRPRLSSGVLSPASIIRRLQKSAPAIGTLLVGLMLSDVSRAGDVYPMLTLGSQVYTNVQVMDVTPVDILFQLRSTVSQRVKRQDLPLELKDKYPYDPAKAAEYEKEQAEKARVRQEQRRRETYAALVRQEGEVQSRIDGLNEDMVVVQKEIRNWRAKPKRSLGKVIALQQLIDKRSDLMRHVDDLRKQLGGVRQQQALWR